MFKTRMDSNFPLWSPTMTGSLMAFCMCARSLYAVSRIASFEFPPMPFVNEPMSSTNFRSATLQRAEPSVNLAGPMRWLDRFDSDAPRPRSVSTGQTHQHVTKGVKNSA